MNRAGLALSITLALGWASCGGSAPDSMDTATVVPVVTASAERGTIRAVIHAAGTIVPAPGAEMVVTAPDVARIVEIPKVEGDTVKTGDLLVRFDIPSATANVSAATAALAQARARADNAHAARTRAHDLFDRGVAARKEVEDADRDVADADAAVGQADGALTAANALVERTTRVATFDGVVAKRAHNPGDLVDGSATDVILRVVDPHRLQVLASVSLADIPRVQIGASARLTGDPGVPDAALRVIARPLAVDPGAPTATLRLAFVGAPRGTPGAPVQIAIDAEEHRNAVLVPTAAIVREGDETAVMVADGAKARRHVVEIGLADATKTEIRSGVDAGDAVIIQGQAGLPDNADIKIGAGEK